MLSSFVNAQIIRQMNRCCQYSIVYGYKPKRSIFDKTSYVDYYIPPQKPYAKSRKPRLSQWDDKSVSFPKILPKPTKLQGKALIKEIEQEELSKIVALRDFHIPDFRVGDVVEMKWIHNISEAKENTYQGLILARRMRNSLEASYRIMFRFCGVEVNMLVKQNSPYLRNIQILKRGAGNIRNKMAIWKNIMTHKQLTAPILRQTMKRRFEDSVKKQQNNKSSTLKLMDDQDPLLN